MAYRKSKHHSNTVLVLLSGGIDSTACIEFYKTRGSSVCALFFDYGQTSASKELAAATRVCHYYRVPFNVVSCRGVTKKGGGLIQGRNAFLLFGALLEFREASGIIAIGVHAGTPYMDCSAQFVKSIQSIFDDYTDGRLRVGAPFLEWTKKDIWNYCLEREIPLDLTYSCELGNRQPCGRCVSCRDIKALNALSKHHS